MKDTKLELTSVDKLKMSIKELVLKVFGIDSEIASLNIQINELKRTNSNISKDNNAFIEQITIKEEKINDLQQQLSDINKQLSEARLQYDKLNEENLNTISENGSLTLEIGQLTEKISELENSLNYANAKILELSGKPIESEQEKFWNNKYPKANIEYTGRTWGTTKEPIPIDVRLLVTPKDYHIHDILKANDLYIKNNDFETGIPKIYNFIRNIYYKYTYDDQNYGIGEFWEFAFEMLSKMSKGYDCDSWADFQSSFYIAAGVPSWKVRVVVGNCRLGGHSTVYVHSDKDNKFHHLNSTYGNSQYKNISEYPKTEDAFTTDDLGIRSVWLSFNDIFAWHQFTAEAKKSFNKDKIYKKFVINPITE